MAITATDRPTAPTARPRPLATARRVAPGRRTSISPQANSAAPGNRAYAPAPSPTSSRNGGRTAPSPLRYQPSVELPTKHARINPVARPAGGDVRRASAGARTDRSVTAGAYGRRRDRGPTDPGRAMLAPVRVLVTGATGNLGRKAVHVLSARPGIEVVQVADDAAADGAGVVRADLAAYRTEWAAAFHGVDVVIHLAGEQSPVARVGHHRAVQRRSHDQRHAGGVRGGRAPVRAGQLELVLAGYRFTSERLTSSTPPRPINPYGVSKLLLERIGIAAAARTGTEFLAPADRLLPAG